MTARVPVDGGVTLAVTQVGPADAPAVLLGHGVGSTRSFLVEAFAEPLVSAGWRLLAYDLRGHGDSTPVTDPAGHRLAAYVDDLARLTERFGPAVIGGVSLGGQVAVAHAARDGTAAGVLACLPAWTGRATSGEGPHAVVAEEVRRVGVPGMLARLGRDDDMPAWLRDLLLRDWSRHDAASLGAALLALDGGDAPTEDDVTGLAVPLAVVSWPDDPGHPDATARCWARTAPRGAHVATTMDAVGDDRAALGRAAVAALRQVGLVPGVSTRPQQPPV